MTEYLIVLAASVAILAAVLLVAVRRYATSTGALTQFLLLSVDIAAEGNAELVGETCRDMAADPVKSLATARIFAATVAEMDLASTRAAIPSPQKPLSAIGVVTLSRSNPLEVRMQVLEALKKVRGQRAGGRPREVPAVLHRVRPQETTAVVVRKAL